MKAPASSPPIMFLIKKSVAAPRAAAPCRA